MPSSWRGKRCRWNLKHNDPLPVYFELINFFKRHSVIGVPRDVMLKISQSDARSMSFLAIAGTANCPIITYTKQQPPSICMSKIGFIA